MTGEAGGYALHNLLPLQHTNSKSKAPSSAGSSSTNDKNPVVRLKQASSHDLASVFVRFNVKNNYVWRFDVKIYNNDMVI